MWPNKGFALASLKTQCLLSNLVIRSHQMSLAAISRYLLTDLYDSCVFWCFQLFWVGGCTVAVQANLWCWWWAFWSQPHQMLSQSAFLTSDNDLIPQLVRLLHLHFISQPQPEFVSFVQAASVYYDFRSLEVDTTTKFLLKVSFWFWFKFLVLVHIFGSGSHFWFWFTFLTAGQSWHKFAS